MGDWLQVDVAQLLVSLTVVGTFLQGSRRRKTSKRRQEKLGNAREEYNRREEQRTDLLAREASRDRRLEDLEVRLERKEAELERRDLELERARTRVERWMHERDAQHQVDLQRERDQRVAEREMALESERRHREDYAALAATVRGRIDDEAADDGHKTYRAELVSDSADEPDDFSDFD